MDFRQLFRYLGIHTKEPAVEMRMALLDAFRIHMIIYVPFFVRLFRLSRVFFVWIFISFSIPQNNIIRNGPITLGKRHTTRGTLAYVAGNKNNVKGIAIMPNLCVKPCFR